MVRGIVAADDGLSLEVVRRYEPSWTPPDHALVRILRDNCRAVLGLEPAANMRVGASDARLYRAAGVNRQMWIGSQPNVRMAFLVDPALPLDRRDRVGVSLNPTRVTQSRPSCCLIAATSEATS